MLLSDEKDSISLTDEEEEEDEVPLSELRGTLNKWTNYIHGWQDRYIVLREGTLSYYKSEDERDFGCRGAISLAKANVMVHAFDECRFDVSVNDCMWYLRCCNEAERLHWTTAIEHHRNDSCYGSENNLRRHGSLISLTSTTSLSTTSFGSFKRGRGLKEKVAEMETFRDILCRQVDTLQSYFDSCASAVINGSVHDLNDDEDIDDLDDYDLHHDSLNSSPTCHNHTGYKGKDLESVLKQHGSHAVDFKGEAITFKMTTAGILTTLSHCIEMIGQREESWRRRLEKEIERRKKVEDAYKAICHRPRHTVVGGPDYEEGPRCAINEDEFFDAVDAALDRLDVEEERRHCRQISDPMTHPPTTSLSPDHEYYNEINRVVSEHLESLEVNTDTGQGWTLIHDEGEMRVYKREYEENGLVCDPLQAVHTVKGITGHEICRSFWDISTRMEWEATLESCRAVEWFSEDTFINHNILKRVWPTAQREALFWSHIRHVGSNSDERPDKWIVVNYSTNHPDVPLSKLVRIRMNVCLICQTLIDPPLDGRAITRDNIKCKITYSAFVNPGGWAPAAVLRQVYKREYPKFLKRFTQYVREKTADMEIVF